MVDGTANQLLRNRRDYGDSANHMSAADSEVDAKYEVVSSLVAKLFSDKHKLRTAALAKEREVRMDLRELPAEILNTVKPQEIEQGFLVESENRETNVRVRKTVEPDGTAHYSMTAKNYPSYSEAETDIDQGIYDGFKDTLKRAEVKKRYKWNGWDIDVITSGDRAGRVVAEYELPATETSIEVPEILRAVANQGAK